MSDEPELIELEDSIEIQVPHADIVFESFLESLKKAARVQQKNLVVDLSGLTAIPLAYVKVLVKADMRLKSQGRRLLVRASRDLRRALRASPYGKLLDLEAGLGDSSVNLDPRREAAEKARAKELFGQATTEELALDNPGYEIRVGNRLVYLDTSKPWIEKDLPGLVLRLEATAADPAILDLTGLDSVSDGVLRRTAHAALGAQLLGKPVRIHVASDHAALVEELGLDRLLELKVLPRNRPAEEGPKLDRIRLAELLSTEDKLPEQVLEKKFENFDKGSYTKKLKETSADDRPAPRGASRPGARPPTEPGSGRANRRRPERFGVQDALLRVHKKAEGTVAPSDLVDLSQSGSQFFAEHEMFVGERVTLSLLVPHFVGEFEVEGKVVWVRPAMERGKKGWRVGVHFTAVPGGSMIKLRRLEGRRRPDSGETR